MKYMRKILTTSFACVAVLATAQTNEGLSQYDSNAPWGWAACSSMTSADDYSVTGGGESTSSNTITLVSDGEGVDMRSKIISAINNYSVIILDGSNGDFTISATMSFSSKSNKTIVGVNNARLCTKFYLTDEIKTALDAANVKSASSTSGGGTLSNGKSVSEQREYLTRQTIINLTGDASESCQKAGIFSFSSCTNIIMRNLVLVGPGPCDVGGNDLLSLTGSKHFWVDHCELTDGIDGNFDITKSSDFNTVTWCIFNYTDRAYDHMNSNLIGSSDSEDAAYLNTTMACNIWGYKCNQRMPMARAGNIHLVNNFYDCAGNSVAVNPRKNSEFLVENCYFATGVKPFSQSGALGYNFIDCYTEDSYTFQQSGTVSVPYAYSKFDVQLVPEQLNKYAGATLTSPLVIGREEGVVTPISAVSVDSDVVLVEYYSLTGNRVNTLNRGINIVRTIYANGKVTTQKVLVK
ncbi:MAG: hypothetical protein E7069_06700 [Bacteroidales bacterium]|jgi:pectate lyase|nr:hypothetical protein [Bacteroidales bacterium]